MQETVQHLEMCWWKTTTIYDLMCFISVYKLCLLVIQFAEEKPTVLHKVVALKL